LAFFAGIGVVIYRRARRRGRLILVSGAGVTLLLIVALVALNVSFPPSAPPTRASPSDATLLARVYDSHGNAAFAGISGRDGSVRWRSGLAASFAAQAPISSGVAYLTSSPGAASAAGTTIVAMRLSDGASLWRRFLPGESINSTLVVRGDMLLFISYSQADGFRANALDLASHTLRWSSPLSHVAQFNVYPGFTYRAFAASGDLLFVGLDDGEVNALRLRDGSLAWSRAPLPAAMPQPSGLALGANQLYVYADDGQIAALRPADGAQLWLRPPGLTPYLPTPDYLMATDTSVYVCVNLTAANGGESWALAALDPATGDIRWERAGTCAVDGLRVLMNSIESAGILYLPGATLTAIRVSDGVTLWKAPIQAPDLGFTSMVVESGVVFAAATVVYPHDYTLCGDWWTGDPLFCHSQTYLAAYDAATGTRYWRADVGDDPLLVSGATP
ncbi:MAG: PQQ-binding-like beta-propeller repeat protein, partial [Ktedonobacterales bacterium]